MNIIIAVIKVIFLLGFLVFIHEGGHFLVAKLCKVNVKEFSLGFGPELFSRNKKETKYSLRLIPLGGYVDLLGEVEQVNEKGSFSNSKISHRIAIVMAGAVVNIIFGLIAYFALMSISGVNGTTIVKEIIPEYANSQSDLKPGDKILMLNGKKVRIKSDVDHIMFNSTGEDIEIVVERNNENIQFLIKPVSIEYNGKTRYFIGVEVEKAESNLKNNLYYGFWETVDFLGVTKDGLVRLFTGKIEVNQMTGPVGISNMVVKTNGIYDFVYLLSVVSLSLGITNLLPIPALDGGKIVILLIEAVRKKKMNEETELQIQSIGFSFLILLSIYVSINDVMKLF